MMLRVIVADDEPIARARLVRLLEETGEATVVADCAGGEAAIAQTLALQPDALFLDVQMPDIDGFQVISALAGRVDPRIVFVTAFDQYAVRAFEIHAFDYLLKPYSAERFHEAFDRVAGGITAPDDQRDRMKALLDQYFADATTSGGARRGQYLERMAVRADGSLKIVKVSEIEWWETDGNYMRARIGNTSHLIRITANALEPQLDPRRFARIHRRYIVNLDCVVEIQPWFAGDGVIVLRGGAKLRLSRTYRERVHAQLLGLKGVEPEPK